MNSHRIQLEGRGEVRNLRSRVGWCTEAKALEKSIVRAAVREAGFLWMNPVATMVDSGKRAVVVECIGRKPCWVLLGARASLR